MLALSVIGNHRTWVGFKIRSFLRFVFRFFFFPDLQHPSKWCFLLRLIFNRLHNQPHIVKQVRLGASCHWWATKVEQPSITGYGQLHLHSLCSPWKRQQPAHPAWDEDYTTLRWECWRGPGAAGTFVSQAGSATSRGSYLLQKTWDLSRQKPSPRVQPHPFIFNPRFDWRLNLDLLFPSTSDNISPIINNKVKSLGGGLTCI